MALLGSGGDGSAEVYSAINGAVVYWNKEIYSLTRKQLI